MATSSRRHARYDCHEGCPVAATLDLMSGKWRGSILFLLLEGPLRFNALQRVLGAITHRTLSAELKALEAEGVISRRVFAEVSPPAVEYALTAEGRSLAPVLIALRDWGAQRLAKAATAEVER